MRDERLRPIERLWSALEERPRLRAVREELMARLGWEYDLAAPFLRASGEKATRYPCPFPSGSGCPRRIILDPDGSIRAVCGCTPKECDSLVLAQHATQILRFDERLFARSVQELLAVSTAAQSVDSPADMITLGTTRSASGKRLAVVLLMAPSNQAAAALTAGIEKSYRQGCVLLTPTDRTIDAETESRLLGVGVKWLVLSDLIVTDSGKLVACQRLADAITHGVTLNPAALVPPAISRRPRGYAANADDHLKVVQAVSAIGGEWSSRLAELCRHLHSGGAAFPESFRNEECVDSWEELADDLLGPTNSVRRERVTKYVKYRLEWVRRNQPAEKSLAKVSR